jgi:hypothetical protein
MNGRDHLEDLGVDGKTTIQLSQKKTLYEDVEWNQMTHAEFCGRLV